MSSDAPESKGIRPQVGSMYHDGSVSSVGSQRRRPLIDSRPLIPIWAETIILLEKSSDFWPVGVPAAWLTSHHAISLFFLQFSNLFEVGLCVKEKYY